MKKDQRQSRHTSHFLSSKLLSGKYLSSKLHEGKSLSYKYLKSKSLLRITLESKARWGLLFISMLLVCTLMPHTASTYASGGQVEGGIADIHAAKELKAQRQWSYVANTVTEDTTSPSPPASKRKKWAIIIDDFGNDMKGTKEMLDLPVPITVAVMPFLPTTKRDATDAHRRGHEVIVHLPMEPNKGRPEWLGPGAITSGLTDAEVRERVQKAIADVPFAVGMNNHMGSKITSDKRIMSIVLDVCKERGMFFVDSRTNYKSVVPELAATKGLPPVRNDIFLDHKYDRNHIFSQMNVVSDWFREHDTCVTIGHVGISGLHTSAAIRSSLPKLQQQADIVGLSSLISDVWHWRPDPTMPTNNE